VTDRDRLHSLQFIEDGKFQKEADMHRLRMEFGDEEAKRIKGRQDRNQRHAANLEKLEREAAMDPNLVPVGERPSAARGASAARPLAPLDDIPEVEWWDADILQNGSYDDVKDGKWDVKMDKFNVYVEHPVPIKPPLDAPVPPPQPLMLTKKEQKKLRTQRRVAREKEKQEMIRQGLIEPPKPKVKISNLMRVLKDEAVLDPTAMEREVREQMAEREQAHKDRNLARMLTPAERREKKMRKLLGNNESGEVHMHVYRVEDMSNTKNRFKVDINAQENHLTGAYDVLERARNSRATGSSLMNSRNQFIVLKASEPSGFDRENPLTLRRASEEIRRRHAHRTRTDSIFFISFSKQALVSSRRVSAWSSSRARRSAFVDTRNS
jgi:U4/U6 small nuclear ribonucleoprotein PRP3